jgi:hypothetical protein
MPLPYRSRTSFIDAQNVTCFAFVGWPALAPYADSTASLSNLRCWSEDNGTLDVMCGGDNVLSSYELFDRCAGATRGTARAAPPACGEGWAATHGSNRAVSRAV